MTNQPSLRPPPEHYLFDRDCELGYSNREKSIYDHPYAATCNRWTDCLTAFLISVCKYGRVCTHTASRIRLLINTFLAAHETGRDAGHDRSCP